METAFLYDPANASLIAGLILLGLDIVVIGLSPVMFVAVGALLTSAVLYATGWRPSLVETAAIVAGAGLLIAIVGRKPLQRFQNADVEEDKSSDLIGRELTTTHEVTKTRGVVFWSGVEWQARLAARFAGREPCARRQGASGGGGESGAGAGAARVKFAREARRHVDANLRIGRLKMSNISKTCHSEYFVIWLPERHPMNMNVSLTDELADFVKAKVAGGRYSSSSEVVREALRMMEKSERQEAEKLRLLRQAWRQGVDSGDVGELDFSELKKEARARRAAAKD